MAKKYGLDPQIIRRQMMQESGGSQNAVSPKGAIGLMQLMPQTAKDLGVDPTDPQQNLEGGMRLMGDLVKKYGGDYSKALAAYNAGPGPVDKAGGVPNIPETKGYVKAIMGTDNQAPDSTDRTAQLLAADQPPKFEPAAAKAEPKAVPFDASKLRPVADPNPGGDTQSWWQMLNTSALSTPIPFTGTSVQGFFDTQNEALKQIVQNEKDHSHPVRAALAEAYYQVQKAATDLVSGATTPANTALAIASGGESVASQTLKAASGLYFGWRGSQEIVNGRLPDESTGDMIRRKGMGLVQAVAGAEGGMAGKDLIPIGPKEAVRAYIQNSLGIGGDLADRVAARVEKAQTLSDAIPENLNKIKSLAAQEITQKTGEFESAYAKLNDKATAPVMTVNDTKSEIINSIREEGVQDGEIAKIQNKIFAALPEVYTANVMEPTAAAKRASEYAGDLKRQGMDVDGIRTALANVGYTKTHIGFALASNFTDLPKPTSDVSYEMTRRVKTDLFHAAQSATDVDMQRGLYAAMDNIDGIRQRYAEDQGFGKQASELDAAYMKFKRELGSSTMSDFMQAGDYADANHTLKQAQYLLNPATGEALRGLFGLAGVDTSPLRQALEDKTAFEATDNIIPGKNDQSLLGKNSLQIRQEALKALGDNARKSGITDPFSFTQIMYGTAQLAFGSFFGTLHIARGLAPTGIRNMLRSESFQNFVAKEAGVTPEAMPKFREMISKSEPYLKKMALSTAVAAGAGDAIKNQSKPISILPGINPQAPAPAPTKTANNIAISQ